MGGFQSLADHKVFGAYASFFYALSAYHQELPKVALDMWKQILVKYPTWDQRREVDYWIAKASLERKLYLNGVEYLERLPEDLRNSLLRSIDTKSDLEGLQRASQAQPDNNLIALLYFQALADVPYEQRDLEALTALSNKFNFSLDEIVSDFPVVKKEKYGIALVLPFMFDSLQSPQTVIRNAIIFDLYQGMNFAKDSLAKKGISLEFFPFDTKKLGGKSLEISRSEKLKKADLIIGPLYADPNKIISAYSKEHEIPMINPLSSTGSIVGDNPLGFLFKPSFDTQGRIAGEYAKEKFTKNKNAIIVFEKERDRVIASAYKEVIEADSFNVVFYDQLTNEDALKLQLDFTEQYEEVLDSLTQDEIDSIALIPNRFVRSRVVRDENTGRIVRDRNGEDLLEYYEMKFTIPFDTIGHIFAATGSNLFANNMISLTEVRGDSIGIIGYDNWLDFRLTSYTQLERLNVSLIHTSYFNNEKASEIAEKIGKTYWTKASEFHLLGYELIMQVGHLFEKHGKHFHRGLISGEYIDGYLMEGLSYGPYRDNQVVPIVTIEDLTLNVQNAKRD